MALRPPRLLSALLAGGLVTGSLLLGAGSALAAPGSDDVVAARCGQTVRAEPGQTVEVTPDLGLPFTREVRAGMGPITQLVGGVLCEVQVQVVEPVASQVAQAAPPLAPVATQVRERSARVLSPTPRTAATPTPRAAAPTQPAAPPALTPQQAAAAAPAFGPAFGALPSSFLRSASGPAPGVRAYDPHLLLGSAFPGLRAGAPAYLGYDPASAVTTASQVQALPVDALTHGGVGVPALIAVLALSGVAALTVRRIALGRLAPARTTPPGAAVDEAPTAAAPDGAGARDRASGDEAPTQVAGPADEAMAAAGATPVPVPA